MTWSPVQLGQINSLISSFERATMRNDTAICLPRPLWLTACSLSFYPQKQEEHVTYLNESRRQKSATANHWVKIISSDPLYFPDWLSVQRKWPYLDQTRVERRIRAFQGCVTWYGAETREPAGLMRKRPCFGKKMVKSTGAAWQSILK